MSTLHQGCAEVLSSSGENLSSSIGPETPTRFGNSYFFHGTLLTVSAIVVVLSVWGARTTKLQVPLWQFRVMLGELLLLLAAALFYRWRQAEKLTQVLLFVFWGIVLSNLYLIPMYICARQNLPCQDALLARFDQAMGIHVPAIVRFMETRPVLEQLLANCYNLLIPLMTVALVVPPMLNKPQAAKEYLVGMLTAAIISMPLFAVFQAEGPWKYYGYTARPDQERYLNVLRSLKTDQWVVFDLNTVEGLITFPSFHTILALLGAAAFWPIRWAHWPAAAFAVVIVLSTVTTGWHYGADIVGGLAATLVAVATAKAFTRVEVRIDSSSRQMPFRAIK